MQPRQGRFTQPANLLTGLPIVALAVLVVVRWPLRPRPASAPDDIAHPYRAWVVLFAAVVAWELAEYAARGSRADHPTLSSMADAVDRYYVLKAVLFFLWLYLGGYRPQGQAGAGAGADRVERVAMTSALSYAVWAVLGLAMLLLWARSRTAGASPARPAVVLDRLATGPILRVALVLAWGWAGWHLFAR